MSRNPHRPTQSSAAKPLSGNLQASFRPDFMANKPMASAQPAPTRPMNNLELARRQAANPYENHGKLTELQSTQLGWEKRSNQLGIRDDVQQRGRIYGVDATKPINQSGPRRPINFNRHGF